MGNLNRRLSLLLLALLFTACSSLQQRDQVSSTAATMVSQDLVNVLHQVQGLNPATTILHLPQATATSDEFAKALLQSLQNAGYAVTRKGGNDQARELHYTISRQHDENNNVVLSYTVNVGDIGVRRAYKTEVDGWIVPVAAIQIRGADASRILMSDVAFERSADEAIATPGASEHTDLQNPVSDNRPSDFEKPETTALTDEAMQSESIGSATPPDALREAVSSTETSVSSGISASDSASVSASILPLRDRAPLTPRQPLLDIVAPSMPRTDTVKSDFGSVSDLDSRNTANVRDLGRSNYADILNEMGTVDEVILTFRNDSTRLGESNKERLRQFVAQFDPRSDVFSVIGCSNGRTNVEGGQEALALGRASRVKAELRFSGIPEDRIKDEGCWAPEQFDTRMPRRGVVLTLKRRS